MAYDMTGRRVNPNAPLPLIQAGMTQYSTMLNVSLSKVVVAFPWYGYDFACADDETGIQRNCSFPKGKQGLWYKVHKQLGYGTYICFAPTNCFAPGYLENANLYHETIAHGCLVVDRRA